MTVARLALLALAGTVIAAGAALAQAQSQSAGQNWHPSKYGAGDEIGAANLVTPERVKAATELVATGKTYPLGVVVDRSTPAYPPRSFAVTVVQPGQAFGKTLGDNKVSYNDDMVTGWFGVGSQLDGLGHLGIDGVFYNGNQVKDFGQITGLTKLGIEKVPPIVGRGVLVDMAKHKGVDMLKEGEIFTADDIKAAAQAQGIQFKEGDVILFHTGWLSLLGKDNERFGKGEPGIDAAGAEYLASLNPVAVGADTWGVEAVPFKDGRVWEGHQILLAKNGIYILETMNTADLAKDGVKEFLFVLGQPRYRGAVQAIINPVAIR